MLLSKTINFLISSLIILVCVKSVVCDEYESEDWVDPGDMISFDPVLKKNIKSKQSNKLKETKTSVSSSTTKEMSAVSEEKTKNTSSDDESVFTKCPPSTLMCPECSVSSKMIPENEHKCNQDNVFMKRFLAFYMRKLAKIETPTDDVEYEVSVRVSLETWNLFENFCNNLTGVSVQEIVHLLESTFFDFSLSDKSRYDRWMWKFESYFRITAQEAVMIFLMVFLLVATVTSEMYSNISWGKQFFRFFVIMFILSYGSTYVSLYQDAVAKQQASHANVPEFCKGQNEMTTLDKFISQWRDWFSLSPNPCQQYHLSFKDPIFKITPLKVFAATMSEFFLEPLEHVGTAFSRTFRNMFADLPLSLWILAFAFIILIMVAVILAISVCFGYSWNLRLPFWSGFEISPSGSAMQLRHHEEVVENYRQRIEDLKQQLRSCEHRLAIAGGQVNQEGWGSSLRRMLGIGQNPDNPSPEVNDMPPLPPPPEYEPDPRLSNIGAVQPLPYPPPSRNVPYPPLNNDSSCPLPYPPSHNADPPPFPGPLLCHDGISDCPVGVTTNHPDTTFRRRHTFPQSVEAHHEATASFVEPSDTDSDISIIETFSATSGSTVFITPVDCADSLLNAELLPPGASSKTQLVNVGFKPYVITGRNDDDDPDCSQSISATQKCSGEATITASVASTDQKQDDFFLLANPAT